MARPVLSLLMEPDALFTVADGGGVRTAPAHAAGGDGFAAPGADAPLPVRMRPATIDELVGQDHLLAPGAPLRAAGQRRDTPFGDPVGSAGQREDHDRAPGRPGE